MRNRAARGSKELYTRESTKKGSHMMSARQGNDKRNDWNPDQCLLFRNERTQASIDLVSRIEIDSPPERILDLGCGPENSSEVLTRRWHDAAFPVMVSV